MLNVLPLRSNHPDIRMEFWMTSEYSEEISSITMDASEWIPSGAVTACRSSNGDTYAIAGVPRGRSSWNLPLVKDEVKKKGGIRKNAGRKPLADVPSIVLTVRVTPKQKKAFQSKGGASWLRDQLDLFA